MKAVEFVKKVTWVGASKVMVDWGDFTQIEKPTHFDSDLNIFIHKNDFTHLDESDVCMVDLKTLVEAKELVDLYGGLREALNFISPYSSDQLSKKVYSPMLELKKAIKLVESVGNA